MRKADVVDKVTQITANDKVEVEEIIDCLLHCIRLELIRGGTSDNCNLRHV